MPTFTPEQITYDRPDGTNDRAIYQVKLPDYTGHVRLGGIHEAGLKLGYRGGPEAWIADKLNALEPRLGIKVLKGRMVSPMDLAD
jgi:hypothetical protein